MRIISGSCRGRVLRAPKGMDTRPTLDRVKESLFGILQFSVPGARVLDLYAGSGNLALEALSRGARFAVLNDCARECMDVMRENVRALRFEERVQLLSLDAKAAVLHLHKQGERFDIAFLDPPYREGTKDTLPLLFSLPVLSERGIAVVEHTPSLPPLAVEGLMHIYDTRRYGDVSISFLKRAEQDGGGHDGGGHDEDRRISGYI